MFDFIWNDIMINPVMNGLIIIANALSDNFGLAIIAFTVIVRAVTYPLTLRQLRATRAMQVMQPQMQAIQKKYKDPKRRQEEMMKLYREAGFNPLGCLWPMLVQIPIWVALYQVIRRTLGDTPEQLLALSTRLYEWDYITQAIPLDRDFLFLDLGSRSFEQNLPLAIIVAVTAFVQQKLSTARTTTGDERQQSTTRMMLWLFPIMFGWFTFQVPAGLGLYWVATSVFTIVTSYYYYFYRTREPFSWRWLISLEPLPAAASAGVAVAGREERPARQRRDDDGDGDETDADDGVDGAEDERSEDEDATAAAARSRGSSSAARRKRRRRRRAGRAAR